MFYYNNHSLLPISKKKRLNQRNEITIKLLSSKKTHWCSSDSLFGIYL